MVPVAVPALFLQCALIQGLLAKLWPIPEPEGGKVREGSVLARASRGGQQVRLGATCKATREMTSDKRLWKELVIIIPACDFRTRDGLARVGRAGWSMMQ